jgi:AraC-like DNA-binding protein
MLMGLALPLNSFPRVRTSDVEEMRAAFASFYGKPVMELVGRDRSLCAIVNHCQLRHVEINYGSYGTDVNLQFPETSFVSQIFPIKGKGEALVEGKSVTIDCQRSVLVSGSEALNITNNAEYERLILCINSESLTKQLVALTGSSIRAPLKMHPAQDFAQRPARLLREHFIFLVKQLSAATPPPSLVLAEFEQTLMVMFLLANQHNYSDLLEKKPSDAALWQVRRAEQYIEANWDKPISLEALAVETDVSARSLFRNFRQGRGYSPMEFLKQTRLCRARQMLQHPAYSTTVTDVAFACGFGDLVRFRNDYFRAFGERPSETLNRSKGPDITRH